VSHSESTVSDRIQGITGPIIGPFGGKWPEIARDALVAPGAVVLDAAVVEGGAIPAAGAVLPPGKTVPSGQLWAGNPARLLRDLNEEEKEFLAGNSQHYMRLAKRYLSGNS
jgi:carbonic anhydrase/acetyltransferase-like protein (isoleucine patch superfamily)